jgi:glutamate-1-semialdehyde 2,1-aminomutase
MLIGAGSGLAGTATPDSAGIPAGVVDDTLVAPLDDIGTLERIFDEHGDGIAAAIIEPLPANYGLLPQSKGFLETLASCVRRHGALLIFDEVITGFRLGFGGFTERTGIRPDLVTYGKILGGGFPVGACGGRRDIMDLLAPEGPVYQAGTLSANPVAMSVGLASLKKLGEGDIYQTLDQRAGRLSAALAGRDDVLVQQSGSIFWLCFGNADTPDGVIRNPAGIPDSAAEHYAACFHHLLNNAMYLPPSPYEVGFVSAAHTDEQLDKIAAEVQNFLDARR